MQLPNGKISIQNRYSILFRLSALPLLLLLGTGRTMLFGAESENVLTFIVEHRAVLENIKAVDGKAELYHQTIAPTIEATNDPVQKTIWLIVGGFATSDYRKNCVTGIASFESARELVKPMDLATRKKVITILEDPDFIDFKVATRLPMGYNAYAVKRLENKGAAADAMIGQLKGWSDYYNAILELLYELSQPLDKCGVCADCVNCPLYKFKTTFFNYKTILNQDEFYKELDFIKQAAIHAQELGRAIESRYDLQ